MDCLSLGIKRKPLEMLLFKGILQKKKNHLGEGGDSVSQQIGEGLPLESGLRCQGCSQPRPLLGEPAGSLGMLAASSVASAQA